MAWLREVLISEKVTFDQLPDIEDSLEDFDELQPLAAFDYEQFRVLIRRYQSGSLQTAKNDIRHEAVHVRRYLLNKEQYQRIRQRQGAGRFLLATHDTLLNPLEVEARVYEQTGLLTDSAIASWLQDNSQGICPLEELISHPSLAVKLLDRHPGFELNSHQKVLISELDRCVHQKELTMKVAETEDKLSDILKVEISALQEILRDAGIDDIFLFQKLFVQKKT